MKMVLEIYINIQNYYSGKRGLTNGFASFREFKLTKKVNSEWIPCNLLFRSRYGPMFHKLYEYEISYATFKKKTTQNKTKRLSLDSKL